MRRSPHYQDTWFTDSGHRAATHVQKSEDQCDSSSSMHPNIIVHPVELSLP